MDSAYDDMYSQFDDLALGVMECNHDVLEKQREACVEALNSSKPITFRFDVRTPINHNLRGVHGCVNSINLRSAAEAVLQQEAGFADKAGVQLPSKTCYLKDLVIENGENTLPVDVQLHCMQSNRVLGNYVQSKMVGEDSECAAENKSSMYIMHAGTKVQSDAGISVHKTNNFVNEEKFTKYLQALAKDVENTVTVIQGGKAVEYVSPWAVANDDNVTKGDWFLDVMYQNPRAFKHPVKGIKTPMDTAMHSSADIPVVAATGQTNESVNPDEELYACSFRCHREDWNNLHDAITTNVINPLRASVINLDTHPDLHFSLIPDVPSAANGDSLTRSGATAWKHESVKDHTGRAYMTLKATLKFV